MTSNPLVVPETNILMDLWLERDQDVVSLFLPLAESDQMALVLPEIVSLEFRGTALTWLQRQRARAQEVSESANQWEQCGVLDEPGDEIGQQLDLIYAKLDELESGIDSLIARIKSASTVVSYTQEAHLAGLKRHLAGFPPDRPRVGETECRVYEAVLEIAQRYGSRDAQIKAFATKDSDFDYPELREELSEYGFKIRADVGRLFAEVQGLEGGENGDQN